MQQQFRPLLQPLLSDEPQDAHQNLSFESSLSFFIMMALASLLYWLGNPIISNENKKRPNHLNNFRTLPRGIIFLGIIYYFPHVVASSFSNSANFLTFPNNKEILSNSTALYDSRSLEVEETRSSPVISLDIRTLSIGRLLSTLRLNPDSIILSNDSRLAFVIVKVYGTLKVIDISDDQNPIIIGSLNLTPIEVHFSYKKLVLSADGKTLFATTIQCLEIIDVSDPQSPALRAHLEDPQFLNLSSTPYYCIPTMALSSDEKILYVAGLGFQIFNITNISHPEILFSMLTPRRPRKMTSLALFPGSKTLLYGDETLDFYDVSSPSKPRLFYSYSDLDLSISSIILSKSAKKVYAAGLNSKNRSQVILEEIDISQQESPKSLGQHQLASAGLGYPSIIGISPNETNIFVIKGGISTLIEASAEMIGFDLLKKQIMSQSQNFFVNTITFVMIPGTNNVITNSNGQFQITKLFKDYPNTKTFCLTNNSRGNFQLSEDVKFIAPSTDQNILFVLSLNMFLHQGRFESYNFTNKTSSPSITELFST